MYEDPETTETALEGERRGARDADVGPSRALLTLGPMVLDGYKTFGWVDYPTKGEAERDDRS